ncbi:MAG: TetR family transcriptional regulator [Roseinatronobacter sp.]
MNKIAADSPLQTKSEVPVRVDTRQRLLSAAIEEFCTHGRSGASTTRIVELAGCNIRMLYHYFGNKDGLYRAALLSVYDDLRAAELQQDFWSGTPTQGVLGLMHFTFDYMTSNRHFPGMILAENLTGGATIRKAHEPYQGSRRLIENLGALIQRGFDSGEFTRKSDPLNLYLTILALSFIHISNHHTLSVTFGQNLDDADFITARRAHAAEVVLGYLGARLPGAPDRLPVQNT